MAKVTKVERPVIKQNDTATNGDSKNEVKESKPSTPPQETVSERLVKRTDREVRYPKLECFICDGSEGNKPPITYDKMRALLGWETEKEFQKRMEEAYPDDKGKKYEPPMGWLLTDESNEKVHCRNNNYNRPFDLTTAKEYAQSVLTKNWAGVRRILDNDLEDSINGEAMIIGNTGLINSAQHRGIGFMLAVQQWRRNDKWHKYWPTEPVFPCVIVRGVSESPRVVRTLDNVRTRTGTDIIYTSGLFDLIKDKGKDRQATGKEKAECSRMLNSAIDFLWKRMRIAERGLVTKYLTNSEKDEFARRFPRLLDCVKHVFQENQGRMISVLKFGGGATAGTAAGLMYLMATSNTEVVGQQSLYARPSEKWSENDFDFTRYDKARDFWALVANDNSTIGGILRQAQKPQAGDNAKGNPNYKNWGGNVFAKTDGGSGEIRLATIIQLWNLWSEGVEVSLSDLRLNYRFEFDDSKDNCVLDYELLHVEDFKVGGLDEGEKVKDDKDKTKGKDKDKKDQAPKQEQSNEDSEQEDEEPDAGELDEVDSEGFGNEADPTPDEIESERTKIDQEVGRVQDESPQAEKAMRAKVEEAPKKRKIQRK